MRILLKGYYGFGNLGDDILMIVSYKLLKEKYPDASITVFSNNTLNNKDSKSPNGYNLYINELLGHEIEIIDWTYKGHFDLIFHGGGGVYFDNRSRGKYWNNSLLTYLPLHWATTLDNISRTLLNKPKNLSCSVRIGAGIGIGRYRNSSSLLFNHMAEIGSYNQLIVRDKSSYDFLSKHKLNKNKYHINTDLAFINSWNNSGWRKRDKIKSVGIVVRDILEDSLVKSLTQMGQNLTARKIDVTFYSFDENYDINCPQIFNKFNFVQYRPVDLHKFLGQLYNEDLLFTTRAHGAILGACLGVPSIIFNLEIKLFEVSEMLKKSCVRIDSWEFIHLVGAFENLEKNYIAFLNNLLLDFRENHKLSQSISKLIQM